MKKIFLTLLFCFIAANAFSFEMVVDPATGSQAHSYSYDDTWVNWPGKTSTLGDENGTPQIDSMNIMISDSGFLQSVKILLRSNSYQHYDSLFISTAGAWDSWDYFVHDGGNSHTTYTSGIVAADGLYSVNDNFTYTYVTDHNRVDNPNGIDAGSLDDYYAPDAEFYNSATNEYELFYSVTHANNSIFYDFSNAGIAIDETSFFVAYAPWCDNDIIGGGTAPVPEPATMVLLGSGLVGLAFYRRKKK